MCVVGGRGQNCLDVLYISFHLAELTSIISKLNVCPEQLLYNIICWCFRLKTVHIPLVETINR